MLTERNGTRPGRSKGEAMAYDELAAAIEAKNRAGAQMRNFKALAAKYKGGRVPDLVKSGLKRATGEFNAACATVDKLIAAQKRGLLQ